MLHFKCFIFILLFITFLKKSECRIVHINEASQEIYTIKEITDQDMVYMEYKPSASGEPFRVFVSSTAGIEFPVQVVIRQEKYVISWTVPLSVEKSKGGFVEYSSTARTLCWDNFKHHISYSQDTLNNFTISLSTYSKKPVNIMVRATVVKEYFLKPNKNIEVTFSPSQPVFYHFPNVENPSKTIFINITSAYDDCFTVSIQDIRCPIYDLIDVISYKGLHETISTKAALTILKDSFPNGFIIVFVAHADYEQCITRFTPFSGSGKTNELTKATFDIRFGQTTKTYLTGIFVLLAFNLLFMIVITLLTVFFYYQGPYRKILKNQHVSNDSVDHFDVIDGIQDKMEHTIADFFRKKQRVEKQSLNYFSHIFNIGIFYGLPVVQLMISYQLAVFDSGDLDICYYNSYCSHPFFFSDFNHIYSNLGYIMFGIFFLCIVRFRQNRYHNLVNCGVPREYGLYYAMGVALIFEGVLSACYHICPNQHNFQFDTSFMYVMAMLLTVKLYQNRHCDYDASVYGFCPILGFLVFVALIGILTNAKTVMIFFLVFYLVFCVFMGFKLYFFAHIFRRLEDIFNEPLPLRKKLQPIRLSQFVFILIANVLNFAIAAGGIFVYPTYVDFGTFILGILMVNCILYCLFYTCLKLIKGETICWESRVYGIVSLILWLGGAYFFMSSVTMWSLSPAKSRELNEECMLLSFYDSHDVWHVISSLALFTSFMFMMSLDDDLGKTPQESIDVF